MKRNVEVERRSRSKTKRKDLLGFHTNRSVVIFSVYGSNKKRFLNDLKTKTLIHYIQIKGGKDKEVVVFIE